MLESIIQPVSMKRVFVIATIGISVSFISCTKEKIRGNGPTSTETRNHANFTGVAAFGSSAVYITQGTAFKVEVKGYSNLIPYYETTVVNNILELKYQNDVNVKNDNIEVYITMPVLNKISIYGSGDISTSGVFPGNTDFNATISGSGNINFSSGTSQNFYSTISGSGNIYTIDMIADKAETEVSGSGNTEITANTSLKVRIAGSGNVYYRGTPVITSTISGSGAVIPR